MDPFNLMSFFTLMSHLNTQERELENYSYMLRIIPSIYKVSGECLIRVIQVIFLRGEN